MFDTVGKKMPSFEKYCLVLELKKEEKELDESLIIKMINDVNAYENLDADLIGKHLQIFTKSEVKSEDNSKAVVKNVY